MRGGAGQHDILWDTLTARQHMLFYGRLKNLRGRELREGVVHALKQVGPGRLSFLLYDIPLSFMRSL